MRMPKNAKIAVQFYEKGRNTVVYTFGFNSRESYERWKERVNVSKLVIIGFEERYQPC